MSWQSHYFFFRRKMYGITHSKVSPIRRNISSPYYPYRQVSKNDTFSPFGTGTYLDSNAINAFAGYTASDWTRRQDHPCLLPSRGGQMLIAPGEGLDTLRKNYYYDGDFDLHMESDGPYNIFNADRSRFRFNKRVESGDWGQMENLRNHATNKSQRLRHAYESHHGHFGCNRGDSIGEEVSSVASNFCPNEDDNFNYQTVYEVRCGFKMGAKTFSNRKIEGEVSSPTINPAHIPQHDRRAKEMLCTIPVQQYVLRSPHSPESEGSGDNVTRIGTRTVPASKRISLNPAGISLASNTTLTNGKSIIICRYSNFIAVTL